MNNAISRNLLLVFVVVWSFTTVLWPGRFPHTDDAYFKEPAYHLATQGRLISPAYDGYFSLEPPLSDTFAAYQPLYVYAAAAWFSLFPFSMASSAAFDALIHLVLVVTLCRFFFVILGSGFSRHLYLFAAALLLLGHPARPDEMAMCLAYSGALWMFRDDRRDVAVPGVLAGLLFGLCAATSFPVTLTAGFWAGAFWLCHVCNGAKRDMTLKRTMVCVCMALVVSLAILLPYYLRDGAWAQYRCIAEDSFFSGLRRSIKMSSCLPYLGMLQSCWRSNLFHFPLYVTSFLMALHFLLRGRSCGEDDMLKRYVLIGAIISWAYIVVAQPDQYLYYWFAFPWFLAVMISRWGGSVFFRIVLCVLVMIALNGTLRDMLKNATLPDEQELTESVNSIRVEVPRDARILVSDRLYFGLREHYSTLRSAFAGEASNLAWAEYCVFCSHRLVKEDGVYIPQTMLKEGAITTLSEEFELLSCNLPTDKPRVAGLLIGSSPVGYGAIIYRRKETRNE